MTLMLKLYLNCMFIIRFFFMVASFIILLYAYYAYY